MEDSDDGPENLKRQVKLCNRRNRRSFKASKKRASKKKAAPEGHCSHTPPETTKAFALSLMGGLKVGSACTGWCAESQALTQLDIPHEMTFMCDCESDVKKILASNVQAKRFHENVFAREFKNEEQVDLLVAGPPCQPYSSEGKRHGSSDPRAKVVYPIVEYAEERKPLMLLLENVPGWQTVGKDVFDEVLARLRAISDGAGGHYYNVYSGILRSEDFGSMSNRKRLYVVALRSRLDNGFEFPAPLVGNQTSFDTILDPGSTLHTTFDIASVPIEMCETKTRQNAMAEVINRFPLGLPCEHVIVDIGTGRENRLHTGKFPCMTATRCQNQDFFSAHMRRRFSLAELARAQGASASDMNLSCVKRRGMGKIIGNAMTVCTLKEILRQMLKCTGLWPHDDSDMFWQCYVGKTAGSCKWLCWRRWHLNIIS